MARRNKISRDAVRRDGSPDNGITGLGNTATNVTGAASAGGAAVTASRSDHTHQGVHSILPATNSGLTATPSTGLGDVVIDGPAVLSAGWPVTTCRIYAVDFVNGLDTNQGFADPTTNSAADYATACALAGTRAKKTFAGLAAIFPRIGNGRQVEIVIASAGANTEQLYAGSLEDFLAGVHGYTTGSPAIRGTGTNATAGSVAFAGSTNDVDYIGAITASGCNVAGYNPVAAFSTTAIKVLKVGGGAAAIPVEPAAPLGWRIRFDSATTTAALRNVCRQVAQVVGTDTLVPQTALPAVPVGTDTCYLEQAGVACGAYGLGSGALGPPSTAMQIAGIRSTGSVLVKSTAVSFKLCGGNLLSGTAGIPSNIGGSQINVHPVLGARTVGGGFRSETSISLLASYASSVAGFVAVTTLTGSNNLALAISVGCYSGQRVTVLNCMLPSGNSASTVGNIGTSTALASPRFQRCEWTASKGQVGGCTIAPAGANPAIIITGQCALLFDQGVCAGTTGNNDVGLDLVNSRGSLIVVITTPTVTGALGDVRLAGGQIISWAQIGASGITDSAGNRILPFNLLNGPTTITSLTGVIFGDVAVPTTSYMQDNVIVGANQNVALRRPTSMRLATRLRATSLVNTSVNNITITLYKNGVATAMQVTIGAGVAGATKFADLIHPILFLDADDFDLRMDDAAGDAGGILIASASLEWAA